ncbi:hypothetical protein ABZ070_26800 [Streptomyces sp. NPDC006283]
MPRGEARPALSGADNGPRESLSDGRSLTADQLAVLAQHRWQRNFYS